MSEKRGTFFTSCCYTKFLSRRVNLTLCNNWNHSLYSSCPSTLSLAQMMSSSSREAFDCMQNPSLSKTTSLHITIRIHYTLLIHHLSSFFLLLLVLNLLTQTQGEDSTDTEAGGEQHQHVGEEGPRLCGVPDQLGV